MLSTFPRLLINDAWAVPNPLTLTTSPLSMQRTTAAASSGYDYAADTAASTYERALQAAFDNWQVGSVFGLFFFWRGLPLQWEWLLHGLIKVGHGLQAAYDNCRCDQGWVVGGVWSACRPVKSNTENVSWVGVQYGMACMVRAGNGREPRGNRITDIHKGLHVCVILATGFKCRQTRGAAVAFSSHEPGFHGRPLSRPPTPTPTPPVSTTSVPTCLATPSTAHQWSDTTFSLGGIRILPLWSLPCVARSPSATPTPPLPPSCAWLLRSPPARGHCPKRMHTVSKAGPTPGITSMAR